MMPSDAPQGKGARPGWRTPAIWISAATAVLVLAYGVFAALTTEPTKTTSDKTALLQLGAKVYGTECAACHGANLEGQPNWRQRKPDGRLPAPPHDETGHTWHHSDEQLFALTKFGPAALAGGSYQSDMPAYAGKLSDHEIRAVLAYIKSRWPENIRERQATITRRTKERQNQTR